jgi:hypothetical protein
MWFITDMASEAVGFMGGSWPVVEGYVQLPDIVANSIRGWLEENGFIEVDQSLVPASVTEQIGTLTEEWPGS